MKKVILFASLFFIGLISKAQFTRAVLQASGLTCSMCSNAINKAVKALPFVQTVKADIKNSAFDIVFRQNATPDIDAVKNAVEDAGFSVATMRLTGSFNHLKVENDGHVNIGKQTFHFLSVKDQTLDGEQTLTIVDKSFVTAKEFKKISKATTMSCLQTGKAAACCSKEGITENTRIYHVTI